MPARWAEQGPGDADPTGGRHAFDQDAALTPIFTTLRRGGWRRSRPLRAVPDPVERFSDDPPTMLLPVVPPLYAVGSGDARKAALGRGVPPVDPYAPASFAPASESPAEATAWWQQVDDHDTYDEPYAAGSHGGSYYADPHDVAYDPRPADPAPHRPEHYDAAPQHLLRRPVSHEAGLYDTGAYDVGPYDRRPYDRGPYDPMSYDPVTDSGRHHRRLAPAGW